MNEKRQNEMIYRTQMDTKHEMDLAGLLAMISSLESRAKLVRAIAVIRMLDNMRKNIERSGVNKKVLRATQIKLEKIQAELIDYKNPGGIDRLPAKHQIIIFVVIYGGDLCLAGIYLGILLEYCCS